MILYPIPWVLAVSLITDGDITGSCGLPPL